MPKALPFTIGADPEFNITMYDKKISAKKIIESLFYNNKEIEKDEFDENMGYKIKGIGTVGWDGCNTTAEIRPDPSNTVEGLTENISKLIQTMAEKSETFDLSTVSEKGSIGGHIHFSLKDDIANNKTKLAILHRQMTSFYLPIMMGENKINLKIRLKTSGHNYNYGDIRDFRVDDGDGKRPMTYEFRVPSAEWITSPKICQATLAYLSMVFNEIINHQSNIKNFKDILYKTDQQGQALQNIALSDFTLLTTTLLNQIRKAVRSFELYPYYKEEVEYILNPNKVLKDKEKVEFNLLYGWGFNKSKPPTKEDLLNAKFINNKTMELDMDVLQNLIWISFNDDTNVSNFVKEIKKRMIAVKWKLNNEYFFFGMKKGINDYVICNKDKEIIQGAEIIKTIEDKKTIDDLFYKVNRKMEELRHSKQADTKKIILVGIPYEERIKENYKKFIEIVYNLEKDCKATTIKREELKDDLLCAPEDKGEIWKIYNKDGKSSIANIQQESSRDEGQERIVRQVNDESRTQEMFLDDATDENNQIDESVEFSDDCDDDDDEDHCDGCDGDCSDCEYNHDND